MFKKYQISFGLIISITPFIQAQDLQLNLKSRNDNSLIEEAYVLNEATGKTLAYLNKQGQIIEFSKNLEWPLYLKIYKMSALDTSLVLTRGHNSICLYPRS